MNEVNPNRERLAEEMMGLEIGLMGRFNRGEPSALFIQSPLNDALVRINGLYRDVDQNLQADRAGVANRLSSSFSQILAPNFQEKKKALHVIQGRIGELAEVNYFLTSQLDLAKQEVEKSKQDANVYHGNVQALQASMNRELASLAAERHSIDGQILTLGSGVAGRMPNHPRHNPAHGPSIENPPSAPRRQRD